METKISAVVLVKNNSSTLRKCISSLNFADEIVVIDDYSTDDSAEIANSQGAKVFQRHLGDDFAAQRNYGIEKTSGEWILFLDSDENVSEQLGKEIINTLQDARPKDAYLIKRTDFIWQKEIKHGEMGNTWLIRLFRKGSGVWRRRVHEFVEVKGSVGKLKNVILHYPHTNLKSFIAHINTFSNLHAKANYEEGKKSSMVKIIVWPVGKFFKFFFLKLGFLDGIEGFITALLMSFHSFLSWGELWIIQKRQLRLKS